MTTIVLKSGQSVTVSEGYQETKQKINLMQSGLAKDVEFYDTYAQPKKVTIYPDTVERIIEGRRP